MTAIEVYGILWLYKLYIYTWIHGYIMLYPKYDFNYDATQNWWWYKLIGIMEATSTNQSVLSEAAGSACAFVVLASLHCGAGDG